MRDSLKAALLVSSALFATPSLAQQALIPPEHYTLNDQNVDLVTGRFVFSTQEVTIGNPGQGGITYGRMKTDNGYWRNSLVGTISITGSVYTVSMDGRSFIFTKSGTSFVPQSARGQTLTQPSSDRYVFTASDGTVATFSTEWWNAFSLYAANGGFLTSVKRPDGEELTYHYASEMFCQGYDWGMEECTSWRTAVRLNHVENNRGYMIRFSYVEDSVPDSPDPDMYPWLFVQKVIGINRAIETCQPYYSDMCNNLENNWPSVTYTSASGVETATDQAGRQTHIGITANGVSSIRTGSSPTNDVSVSYSGGKVSAVTDASGTWTYAYADVGNTRTTTATGPLGQSLTVVSNQTTGRALSVKNALNETTTYQYDSQRRLQRVTQPGGDYTHLTYDARGNVTQTLVVPKAGSGLANITTSATYPATCTNPLTCNSPVTTTDAGNAVTNYSYHPTHGGVTVITRPAPVSGGVRPETRISYAAQTAYYKNSAGAIVAAPSAVTLPTAVSTCAVGTSPSCVGTANESRTTFTYGASGVANNLLPTVVTNRDGAGALSAATTLTYTPNGDVASVNGPLAGTADTTLFRYDDVRQRIGVVGPDPDGTGALLRRAQRYTYNPRGAVTLAEQGTVTATSDAA